MNEELMKIIFEKDEITWQSLLYQLIKSEGMDMWDIDVSLITKHYIEMLKKLKELDFHVSGKVVLAAAILLKVKSMRLIGEDLSELDRMIAGPVPDQTQDFYDELEAGGDGLAEWSAPPDLFPKTPQPRQRKVSIYDLVGALQKALEVRHRRMLRHMPRGRLEVPEKKIDITKVIELVWAKVLAHYEPSNAPGLTFKRLVEGSSKHEQVLTFISLLNLAHYETRKIDLLQQELFGEIEINLVKPSASAQSAPAAAIA